MYLSVSLLIDILLAFAFPQQTDILSEKYKAEVVGKISDMMTEAYVYEDVAYEMKVHLENKLQQGRFSDTHDYTTFSKALNDEALAICNDKHLRIRASKPAGEAPRNEDSGPSIEARMLDNNIGYVELHSFMDPNAKKRTNEAMEVVENADVLVIDIRDNGGGSPDYVRYVCSYFFDGKVLLNSLYWRYRDKTDHFYTLENIPGSRRTEVPLYILVSNHTFSAAEEFAYNLQSRGRATIIGETTGGGAHPVNLMKVDSHIEMVLPVGRAINPITKTNWEGVGITPDIITSRDEALNKALEIINN